MPFLTELDYSPIRGKRKWTLDADLVYRAVDGRVFVLQKGYKSDQASVPRLFWSVFPKDGKYRDAAWLHDAGYTMDLYIRNEDGSLSLWVPPNRRAVDRLFLEAMRDPQLNVKCWRSWTIYKAVRRFGWLYWKKNHKRIKVKM